MTGNPNTIILDTPISFSKDFAITSIIEKQALLQNDIIIEDQYIEISGFASKMYYTDTNDLVIDADQESVSTWGMDLKRLKNGILPLLFNHQQDKAVGSVLEATYQKDGLFIKAKLYKFKDDPLTNYVYNAVKNGVIKAFSVGLLVKGFDVVEQDSEEYLQLSESEVIEISLVAVPSNPEALFRIQNIKSVDGSSKMATLLRKVDLKAIGDTKACDGFSCAYSKHKEALAQKEVTMEVKEVEVAISEEKETVINVTQDALDKLDEIQNPAAPVEDTKPTEGATVTPDPEDSTIDKSNDKPSETVQEDLTQTPEEALHNSLQKLTDLNVDNLSDDEMEQVYEALAPIIDKINERVVASIADMMKESMTISAPAE